MSRQIVHMDLDAFYVSCTLLKMPELKGKPLIIGGTSNRGVVTSASYEARRYGVKAAMPTRLALQRCPDAIILKGDFDLFTEYSGPLFRFSSIHKRTSRENLFRNRLANVFWFERE